MTDTKFNKIKALADTYPEISDIDSFLESNFIKVSSLEAKIKSELDSCIPDPAYTNGIEDCSLLELAFILDWYKIAAVAAIILHENKGFNIILDSKPYRLIPLPAHGAPIFLDLDHTNNRGYYLEVGVHSIDETIYFGSAYLHIWVGLYSSLAEEAIKRCKGLNDLSNISFDTMELGIVLRSYWNHNNSSNIVTECDTELKDLTTSKLTQRLSDNNPDKNKLKKLLLK